MKTIRFSKFFLPAWVFSIFFILGGLIYTLSTGGFKQGIDFSSGFLVQISLATETDEDTLRSYLALELSSDVQVQKKRGERSTFIVKGKVPEEISSFKFVKSLGDSLKQILLDYYPETEINVSEISLIDPSFSSSLISRTVWLVIGVMGLILAYIWVRFQLAYAVASVFALAHNVIAMLSFIGFTGIELSIPVVVSLLTIVGYSLNDTIVIFDRVRENIADGLKGSFTNELDISLTQTLSRTLVTSLTTFMSVLMVVFFTSGTVHDFSVSFIAGIVIGTYSSLFIASSLLAIWFEKRGFCTFETKEKSKPTQTRINIEFRR